MKLNKTMGSLILFSILLCGIYCKKTPPPQEDSLTLINKDFREDKIDVDKYILLRVESIFAPKKLPPKFRSDIKKRRYYDLDTLYMEIKFYWSQLKEKTREQLQPLFLRPTDPDNLIIVNGDEINFAYEENAEIQTYNTTFFRIHYVLAGEDAVDPQDGNLIQDPDGNAIPDGIPDYVNKIGEFFEFAHDHHINTLGLKVPPSDITHPNNGGNEKIDVYIKSLVYGPVGQEHYFYGVSVPQTDDDNPYCLNVPAYSYIMMHNDYATAVGVAEEEILPIAQETSAHEMMHTVMFGYMDCWEGWLAESIAMWVQDEVFDHVNNYLWWTPYANEASLDSDQENTWPWARCLAERYGKAIVKEIIENYQSGQGILKIDQVLQNHGSNLTTAFVDFSARNFTKKRRYGISMEQGEPYEEGNTFETHDDFITINVAPAHSSVNSLIQGDTYLEHLSTKYFRFNPFPEEANSPTGKRTFSITLTQPNKSDCIGKVILETEDNRMIELRMKPNDSGNPQTIISGFGGDVNNKVDIKSIILMLTNATTNQDNVNFHYDAGYLSGPDLQITPWGWSWGYKNPFFKSSDIQIQNTQGRLIINPVLGHMNRIEATVRNLGDQDAENVEVSFYYAPFGIGVINHKLIGSETVDLDKGEVLQVPMDWDLTDLSEDNNNVWPQPIKYFDHFCLRVEINHPDDVNPYNNRARHNFAILTPDVPIGILSTTMNPKLLVNNHFDSRVEAQIFIDPSYFLEAVSARPGIRKPFTIRLNPMEKKYINLDVPFPFSQGNSLRPPVTRTMNIYMKIKGQFIGGISYGLSIGN